AVILTGAGKMFCGGGDLKHFAAQGEALPAHLKELAGCLHMAISRFVRMEAPLVVAVNGSAGGAGLSLCLFGDIVLAGESSKFTLAYTKAGLAPEMALTNRVLSAREALDWGLVTQVVADGQLQAEAQALASRLASGATRA